MPPSAFLPGWPLDRPGSPGLSKIASMSCIRIHSLPLVAEWPDNSVWRFGSQQICRVRMLSQMSRLPEMHPLHITRPRGTERQREREWEREWGPAMLYFILPNEQTSCRTREQMGLLVLFCVLHSPAVRRQHSILHRLSPSLKYCWKVERAYLNNPACITHITWWRAEIKFKTSLIYTRFKNYTYFSS